MNPLFKTTNSQYGENWKSSGTTTLDVDNVPQYKEIGERELALQHSMKTYKHEMLKELREKGDLDTTDYPKMKETMSKIKTEDIHHREFPIKAEEVTYPTPTLNAGSLLYRTSNNSYGAKLPTDYDLPGKFYPKVDQFTRGFLGGNFRDTGLNTSSTPSRVHKEYDN